MRVGVGMTGVWDDAGEGGDGADAGSDTLGGMLAAASVGGCGRLLWNGAAPSCGYYCFTVIGRLRAFFDSCLGNEMLSTPFW